MLLVTSGASKAGKLAKAWTGDDVRELPVRAARHPDRDLDPGRGGRRGAAAGLSPRQPGPGQADRSASVGGTFAARSAGYSPATAPTNAVAPMATPIASGDTTTGHAWVVA